MSEFKEIILRSVDDEGEFDIHVFIEDVTAILSEALSVDDPKVAARVLVDAAVGHWRKLGAHHQEIGGHLRRAEARVLHRGEKEIGTVVESHEDRGADSADRSRKAAAAAEPDIDPPEAEKAIECRRYRWNRDECAVRRTVDEPSLARIDIDGLKVAPGSLPDMPFRLHLLAPGGGVAKLLSGRGRSQDLELWLNTALRKLPQGYGWRLIGQSGKLMSFSRPACS